MCKLLVGVQLTDAKHKEFEELISAQFDDMKRERDGISALTMDKNGDVEVLKELSDYDSVFQEGIKNIKNRKCISFHTRTKTTGAVSKENLHFFEDERYLFAHNGIVGKYSGWGKPTTGFKLLHCARAECAIHNYGDTYYPDCNGDDDGIITVNNAPEYPLTEVERDMLVESQFLKECMEKCVNCNLSQELCSTHYSETLSFSKKREKKLVRRALKKESQVPSEPSVGKTDSEQFIKNIPRPFTRETLEKEMREKDFSGIACIFDKVEKKIWLLGTRDIDVHTDYENYIIFYSFTPESEIKKVEVDYVCDIPVYGESEEVEYPACETPKGVYEISLT